MNKAILINFPQDRNTGKISRTRDRINAGKKGRVYIRGEKLWVDFHYLDQRIREPSGLTNTAVNQRLLRRQLDLIMAEIENGLFEFGKRFPHSSKKVMITELEGRVVTTEPEDVLFGDYYKKWWQEMTPGANPYCGTIAQLNYV